MPYPRILPVLKKMFEFARHAQISSANWTETTTLALSQMFFHSMNAKSGVENEMITWVTVVI